MSRWLIWIVFFLVWSISQFVLAGSILGSADSTTAMNVVGTGINVATGALNFVESKKEAAKCTSSDGSSIATGSVIAAENKIAAKAIGEDDLFKMVRRRYQLKDRQSLFLTDSDLIK